MTRLLEKLFHCKKCGKYVEYDNKAINQGQYVVCPNCGENHYL